MEIIWSRLAKITFFEILEKLKERWTRKEYTHFNTLVQKNLHLIKDDHAIFPKIAVDSAIRKAVIHPNVSPFYFVKEQEKIIYLVTFFNNRMNPDILERLLDLE